MQIELTRADWLICCLTLGLTVALGLYLAMRAHSGENSANFFLAGRSMIWPVIGGSLFATNIGAEHLVGLSGDCYRYGLKAGAIEVCALVLGFGAAYLFPYYLKNEIFTIPQFLELRFGVKSRLVFAGFTLFVSIVMKLALALFAGALVMKSLLGMDVMTTVFIMGAVAAAITILGGFAAVTYTDGLQSIIMIVGGTVMLFIGLDQVGGWSELVNSEPVQMSIHGAYDDPNFPFWGIVAASFYAGMFYWCFDQTNVQRVLGARDLPQARWGVMLAIFLKLSVIFIVAVPGVIAFVLYPDIGDSKLTFVTLLNKLLPSGIRGLVLAALIAALISSLDSVLNAISTITVRDFGLFLNPDLSEKQQVFIGRASIIAGTLLGIAATYMVYTSEEGVYRYFQALAAIIFSAVTPAILFGILSRRVTTRGALVSFVFGCLVSGLYLVDEWLDAATAKATFPWLHMTFTEAYSYRGAWNFLAVTAVLFTASALTQKDPPEKLEKTTVDWTEKREAFQGLTDWRLHFSVLTVLTIAIYAWLW